MLGTVLAEEEAVGVTGVVGVGVKAAVLRLSKGVGVLYWKGVEIPALVVVLMGLAVPKMVSSVEWNM